jgi:phosphatidylserine/phosphatidylglycerophosphate/cardiolipin synthase-like enzyme
VRRLPSTPLAQALAARLGAPATAVLRGPTRDTLRSRTGGAGRALRGLLLVATALLVPLTADPAPPPGGSVRLIPVSPIGRDAPTDTCETDACKALLQLIDGAKTRIDFAVYGVRKQTAILDALERAKKRGVAIRGVVDKDPDDQTYYSDTDELTRRVGNIRSDHLHDRAAKDSAAAEPYDMADDRCPRPAGFMGPLQCVGYDLGDRCLVSAQASSEELAYDGDIMHDKFFVVDERWVWTGSANISDSDVNGYSANLVTVFDSPDVAAIYTREIDQMYDGGKFHEDKAEYPTTPIRVGDTTVRVWFPPKGDPIKPLRELIQNAEKEVRIGVFYFTHKQLAADVIAAHLRGVDVKVIVDATSAGNGYTKHELLRAAGVPVKVEDWGGKMHAKSMMVDDRWVVGGSMNWTSAGHRSNDENFFILDSPAAAGVYEDWWTKLWADVDDKWLEGRPDPESKDSGTSCTDKSDNDFDSKKDAEDPGCGPNPPPVAELPPYRIVPKTDGYDLIKGNVAADGKKTYHLPTGEYYANTRIDTDAGERWFCSEDEARAAGWKRSGR